MTYTESDYRRERAICDKASAYAERIMCEGGAKRRRNFLTKEEASAPVYVACDNAMRGRVEQFEILRDLPERFTAYLSGEGDGVGAALSVTCWPGDKLGVAYVRSIGPRRGWAGERQHYGRAMIGGAEYAWQGPGRGMYAHFRKLKNQKG